MENELAAKSSKRAQLECTEEVCVHVEKLIFNSSSSTLLSLLHETRVAQNIIIDEGRRIAARMPTNSFQEL